jgi:hypothetical protein
MNPTVTVIDEGVRTEYELIQAINEGVSIPTVKSLLDVQTALDEEMLVSSVDRNSHVAERAVEENVFAGQIILPGWFVNNDAELSDKYGEMHPGARLTIEGLVEDYSEPSWRVVASRDVELPGLIFEYEWTFLPKSVVTLIRLDGIGDMVTADRVSEAINRYRRNKTDEWADITWQEMLEAL